MKIPGSTTGWVLAGMYAVLAVCTVVSDRREGGGGGWISLSGTGSFLATFPVSALGEMLGMKPDFRRNLDMAFAIAVCTALVYGLGALIVKGVKSLLQT